MKFVSTLLYAYLQADRSVIGMDQEVNIRRTQLRRSHYKAGISFTTDHRFNLELT